jgi:hypothetical protein
MYCMHEICYNVKVLSAQVSDTQNNRIVHVTYPAGFVKMYAGSELGDAGNRGGPTADARFDHPTSLALDGGGVLVVADSFNYQIVKIADGQVSPFAGVGGDRSAQDGPANMARFQRLTAIAIDRTGNLFVADGQDDELRVVMNTDLQPPLPILEQSIGKEILEQVKEIYIATQRHKGDNAPHRQHTFAEWKLMIREAAVASQAGVEANGQRRRLLQDEEHSGLAPHTLTLLHGSAH